MDFTAATVNLPGVKGLTDALIRAAKNACALEIATVMVASTSHLTMDEAITELASLGRSSCSRSEGFLIHTRLGDAAADEVAAFDAEADISESGRRTFELARAAGCEWILFDADGPELPGIPTHEW